MNARDTVVFAAVVIAFAIVVTAHVWIVIGLLGRPPRWRAPIALVVLPLAPYWAIRERMLVRAIAWIGGVIVYAIARVLAMR